MRKEPRLHFTKEEREDPALEKPIRRADRAAARADKAQAAIPKKKVTERIVNPDTGTITTRLHFEDKKKPPSKLTHTLRDAPAGTVLGAVHREINEAQEDNVGVEAAHKSEQAAEAAGRLIREGYHSHKLRPYRKAAAAERKLEKANINALYQKSLRENPQLASNPVSRWRQKQAIKQQYAARRAGQTGAATGQAAAQSARSAKAAAKRGKRTADFVRRHKKGFLIAGGLLLAVAFFLNCMSSCSVLLSGVGGGISGSTYPSADEAMLGAEAAYAGMEAELQAYLDNYEANHDYDEYHFDLGENRPRPLCAHLPAHRLPPGGVDAGPGRANAGDAVRPPVCTHGDGGGGDPLPHGDPDGQRGQFLYRPGALRLLHLFCDAGGHRPLPPSGVSAGRGTAEYVRRLYGHPGQPPGPVPPGGVPKRVGSGGLPGLRRAPGGIGGRTVCRHAGRGGEVPGLPLCVGRSSPSTSFDCSGFVSWVINHSGWDVGRLGAQSLFNLCTPVSAENAKPGDLVFFTGTFDCDTPVSHCGIYVGGGMMIHAGSPISYADLSSSYWQEHLYSYARLP